jgi:hypothetical protein
MDANQSPKWMSVVGLICHVLVGGLMLFACGMKAYGKFPPEMLEQMTKYGVADNIRIIGVGGLVSAILMIIPRTSFLGSLAVSSYWGGAICLHMSHHEPYLIPSVLVLLTWTGAILRHPTAFLNRA